MHSLELHPKTPIPAKTGPLYAQWLVNEVNAGFPSPAEDMGMERIDLNQILMTHPQAPFFMRVNTFQSPGTSEMNNLCPVTTEVAVFSGLIDQR